MRGGEEFLTENDLIKKCKKGSREAFNILFINILSYIKMYFVLDFKCCFINDTNLY